MIFDVVAIEHLDLGFDFDGAATVFDEVSGLSSLTQALMEDGFDKKEIMAIMESSVLRVLR